MPPRPPLDRSLGRSLDLAMADAWPSAVVAETDDLLLRATEGVTRRANSALVTSDLGDAVHVTERVEQFYGAHGLAPTIMVSDALTSPRLQHHIEARGYEPTAETWVLHRPLAVSRPDPTPTPDSSSGSKLTETPTLTDPWFDTFWSVEGGRRGQAAARLYREVLLRPSLPTRFATFSGHEGPISVGQLVMVGDVACLQCLATTPAARQQGAGRAVVEYLVAVASSMGATNAFAAVMTNNAASLGLFKGLGFEEHHRYRYLIRPEALARLDPGLYLPTMALDALPAEHIGTLSARTNDVERPTVAGGPFGTKVVATVTGGTFVGPNINAAMPDGVAAGDWLTIRADGSFALDVRFSLRTDDGADIYVTYTGLGTRNEDGTSNIRTAPRFETGDERYAWLNNLFCVAIGATTPDGVEYEIYAV